MKCFIGGVIINSIIPAQIKIEVDDKFIKARIEKQLDECIQSQLWFVDVKKLSELTCFSIRSLEEDILNDVRMKSIEIRKARKRYYEAKKAFETIKEIMLEW